MSEKNKQVAIAKTTYSLGHPHQMTKLAVVLKAHIKQHNLTVNIQGKDYIYVEGWQFAGGMMGLFPKIVSVKKVEGSDIAYIAEAQIINAKDNTVMGTGYAFCSKKESKKASFDEYAIMSMAQTRAIGKAYRNLIGWVMKMTGYESTPAEEMPATPEQVANMVSEVEQKIKVCKSISVLQEYEKKIKASKKYSAADKEHLCELILARANEIESDKN